LAEIIEKETEAYYKMDPDPFDDRHPGKPSYDRMNAHICECDVLCVCCCCHCCWLSQSCL